MCDHESNYHFSNEGISPDLAAHIGEYSVLDLKSGLRLMVPTSVLLKAGIVSGPEGDEFDLDAAIETVRENAFDPALN